jgi:hypothetical protein
MDKEEYIKQLRYEKWVPLLRDLQTYKLQVLAEKYKGLFNRHMINSLTEEIAEFIMWAMEREAKGIRSGRGSNGY